MSHIYYDPRKIQEKFNELAQHIVDYDSDTFNGGDVTDEESALIAEKLVIADIKTRLSGERLDGDMLSDLLEEVREKN